MGESRSQYDTTFKDLFEQPPQRLLQVLVGRRATQLLRVEFASTQKRIPDLLFLMEDNGIFHLELHGKPEEMNWRMLGYYSSLRQRYPNKTLTQKLLYVGQEKWCRPTAIKEKNLKFRYQVVDIRTIDCRLLLASPTVEENILAVLCRMDNQKETIRKILHRITELPNKARDDALTKLLLLSRLRKLETTVTTEAADMALTFNVMENDVLRPLFLKAQQESELRGKVKGEAEILLRLLTRRFGELAVWAREKVSGADSDTLEMWSDRVLEARSLEEVIGNQSPDKG